MSNIVTLSTYHPPAKLNPFDLKCVWFWGGLTSNRLVLIKQPQRSWALVKGEACSPAVQCLSLWFIFSLEELFAFPNVEGHLGALGRSRSNISMVKFLADALPEISGLGWCRQGTSDSADGVPLNLFRNEVLRKSLQYNAVIVSLGSKSFRKQGCVLTCEVC